MKAVILAAGIGRRLAGMGWTAPKCLLTIGGRTLLENTITSLPDSIGEIVLVVGHQRVMIERELARLGVLATLVENDDYATTNTACSLWLARRHLDGGFLYFNGDVMFDAPMVSALLAHSGSVLSIIRKPCGDEEVKVVEDARGRVVRIGKRLPPEECAGEFIGIGRFDAVAAAQLCDALERLHAEPSQRNDFFEDALDGILDRITIHGAPLEPWRAVEIDTPEDFALARRLWSA